MSERMPVLMDENAVFRKKKKVVAGKKASFEMKKMQDGIPVEAILRLIHYAYSGSLDEHTLTPYKAVDIIRIATILKLQRISELSQKYLQSSLNIDNIYKLLKLTDSTNVEKAKEICMDFALSNVDFFTSASAESLGFKLYQEVTALMLKKHQGQNIPQMTAIQVSTEDTLVEDYMQMYASNGTKDICFMIQGEEIKVHKGILQDVSPKFSALANQTEEITSLKPRITGEVYLDPEYANISSDSFRSLLRFLYYSDTGFTMLNACELFIFAKNYKILNLDDILLKVISVGEINLQTALPLLYVSYSPQLVEYADLKKKLKDTATKFVITHADTINFAPLQYMSSMIGSHILFQIQQVLAGTHPIQTQLTSGPKNRSSKGKEKNFCTSPTNHQRNDASKFTPSYRRSKKHNNELSPKPVASPPPPSDNIPPPPGDAPPPPLSLHDNQ